MFRRVRVITGSREGGHHGMGVRCVGCVRNSVAGSRTRELFSET